MKTDTTKITRSNVRDASYRRRRLLIAATYRLTSSLITPTLHAAHCSVPKDGSDTGVYRVKSARPFLSDRCVQIKLIERAPATLARVPEPSQNPTTPRGNTR